MLRAVFVEDDDLAWMAGLVERENSRFVGSGVAAGVASIRSGEARHGHKVRDALRRAQHEPAPGDPWDDEDIVAFHNGLLDAAPDDWDSDADQSEIIARWVAHLVGEVKRSGGCLRTFCAHIEGGLCDHGYLSDPVGGPHA